MDSRCSFLPRLENAPLRVDERNSVAAELKFSREIGGIEDAAAESGKPVHVIESRSA
jgi:hypothetical protein